MCFFFFFFFFFKQKTAYEMVSCDWSSDVCSSDLGPDKYTVVATVATMRGAKTISVDQMKHVAYLFQPEYGPAPAPAPGSPPPAAGGRGPRGPVIAAWFFAISH